MTTPDLLSRLLNSAIGYLKEHGELPPSVVAIRDTAGQGYLLFPVFSGFQDKDQFAKELVRVIASGRVAEVAYAFEVWVRTIDKDDKNSLERAKTHGIAHEADKTEAFMFYHEASDSPPQMFIAKIQREGENVTLEAPEKMDGVAAGGRFSDLWKQAQRYGHSPDRFNKFIRGWRKIDPSHN